MLTPLLVTLVLLQQAPASPDGPIPVLIAPPDTAGVPGHVVEFGQEHVAEQARAKGLTVIRMKDFIKKIPSAKRKALLRCKRSDLKCLTALGTAAQSEVVLVAEMLKRGDGYRVGTKIYKTQDGGLVAEKLIPDVREDGILDALTQSLDAVVPAMIKELRPSAAPPPDPTPPDVTPPPVTEPPPHETPTVTPTVPPTVTPTVPPTVTPVVPPVEEKKEPLNLRRWAWAPAAGGAVFVGAGTLFFLQAKDKHDQLTAQEQPDTPLNGQQLAEDGRRAQNLSRIAFGLGAVGLVTGAIFYMFPGEDKPVRPSLSLGPDGGMVGIVGTLP